MKRNWRKVAGTFGAATLLLVALAGCAKGNADVETKKEDKPVVVYSNADDEAVEIFNKVLKDNKMDGQYKIQVFGTSELGGKLAAEKTNIEADVMTLSTFYLDSAKDSLTSFDVKKDGVVKTEDFQSPIIGLEGSLITNTEVAKKEKLPEPKSIKDLANPVYKNQISVPDLHASSTGWLFVQAIIDNYGEKEGKQILVDILKNVGPHLEESGSAPIKKARAGEIAFAFGLRHQGAADEEKGLPIKVIDVTEGNYLLTESIAVVKHDKLNGNAKKVADLLANKTREDLQKIYPTQLYKGEKEDAAATARVKRFPEALTVDLLKAHQKFFEEANELAKK